MSNQYEKPASHSILNGILCALLLAGGFVLLAAAAACL